MTDRVGGAMYEVAYRMFVRNVVDYGEPALIEQAWLDPDIQQFWLEQAEAVISDLRDLSADEWPLADSSPSSLLLRPKHPRSHTTTHAWSSHTTPATR